jgi:hypothetical protein
VESLEWTWERQQECDKSGRVEVAVDPDCEKLDPDWGHWRPPGPRLLGEGQSAPGKTEAPLGGKSEAGPDDVRPLEKKARGT